MQSFIPLAIDEQKFLAKKTNKYSKLLVTMSYLFLVIMFFFSTIVFASLYTHDSLITRHLRAFKAFIQQLPAQNNDVTAIKLYYRHQHQADYVFALLLFIFTCVAIGFWALIFLFRGKRNIINSRLSNGLLHFLCFIICVTCIVCFIYYMSIGEGYINNLKTIQSQMGTWQKSIAENQLATQTSFEYIRGYISSILDIIRPFVIVDFIVSIIYIIIEIALLGLQAKNEKIFRAF